MGTSSTLSLNQLCSMLTLTLIVPSAANKKSTISDASRQDVPSGATDKNTRKSGGSGSGGANPSPGKSS